MIPAEWAPHRAMWLGFPSHEVLWEDDLPAAQAEVAALARALAGPGREQVKLMTGSPMGDNALIFSPSATCRSCQKSEEMCRN